MSTMIGSAVVGAASFWAPGAAIIGTGPIVETSVRSNRKIDGRAREQSHN